MAKFYVAVRLETEGGEMKWFYSKPMTERAARQEVMEHEAMNREAKMYEVEPDFAVDTGR